MQFDPYALCPGGRDKKIRFCCPDMVKEIEQVGRLLESKQTGACLSYIETLEQKHPNCACLTTAKLSVYRAENRWSEALPIAEAFYARESENPTAAAEYALALIVTGNPKQAVSILVDAFERTKADTVHSALMHSSLQAATYLLLSGFPVSAIGIGHVLKEIPSIAEAANMFLYRATSETQIPLMIRDWAFDFNCPDKFPRKETFEEVAVLVRLMCWKQALALLETLIPYADVWPGIWTDIAIVNAWLMNTEPCSEALKKYAASPNTPEEDAIDAETIRMLSANDPLGDLTEILTVEYPVSDADKALEMLLSNPYFQKTQIADWQGTPPPRGVFIFLDRPQPSVEEAKDSKNRAMHRATAILFGKETDKEARLILQTLPIYEQSATETLLRDILGDLVQIPGNITRRAPVSRSSIMAEYRLLVLPAKQNSKDEIQQLVDDYYSQYFTEAWLNLPLGVLDGKTPTEAAKDTKYAVPLKAALQRLQYWGEFPGLDCTKAIRAELGFSPPEPIIPGESVGNDPLAVLDVYPVWRWYRIDVTKLSTDTLYSGLQIVLGMQEMRSAMLFAQELLNRPIDSMQFAIRIMAFEALIAAAQNDADIEQALLWVERAKNESREQKVPDAAWYLHEITLHLVKGDGQAAQDAMQYLVTNYGNNDNVMKSLQELLVRIGMLNPDGTLSPAIAQRMQSAEDGQQEIWTPDAANAPATAPSKLWVPE